MKSLAIQRLRPRSQFTIRNEKVIFHDDTTPPTEQEINSEIEFLKSDDYQKQQLVESWRKSASLSRRRFKIGEALYQVNGTPLVQLIEALLAGLPEPNKTVATIAYNESGRFDRLDQFVVDFSQALGMIEEQTDEFFRFCLEEQWNQ